MTSQGFAHDAHRARPLGGRAIGRFFVPLMLNAWLMTVAGPLLNVAIGRAAEPQLHLAAFWIAFSILLVCQSACLVLQQVTASALERHVPFDAVALSGGVLGAGGTLVVLAIACTPLGDVVLRDLVPVPALTAHLARAVLARMAVIPLLVALRGLANGVAVAQRRTEWLAVATLVRVLVLASLAGAVLGAGLGAGAIAATWMLVAATAAEALFVCIAVGVPVLARRRLDAPPAGWRAGGHALGPVLRLALPLAVASLAWTSARPLVGAILGRLAQPELALAGFGVVFPILMLTCAPLWAFLDVAIVLPRTRSDLGAVARFALLTSLVFTAGIAALARTPAASLALRAGGALPPELVRTVVPALQLIALEPLVLSARALAQGLLVRSGRGGTVLALSPVKLGVMLGAGLLVARLNPHANGAVLALALFIGGDAIDAVLLGSVAIRSRGVLHAARAGNAPSSCTDDERKAA
jgi:hypothetical protein